MFKIRLASRGAAKKVKLDHDAGPCECLTSTSNSDPAQIKVLDASSTSSALCANPTILPSWRDGPMGMSLPVIRCVVRRIRFGLAFDSSSKPFASPGGGSLVVLTAGIRDRRCHNVRAGVGMDS